MNRFKTIYPIFLEMWLDQIIVAIYKNVALVTQKNRVFENFLIAGQ